MRRMLVSGPENIVIFKQIMWLLWALVLKIFQDLNQFKLITLAEEISRQCTIDCTMQL